MFIPKRSISSLGKCSRSLAKCFVILQPFLFQNFLIFHKLKYIALFSLKLFLHKTKFEIYVIDWKHHIQYTFRRKCLQFVIGPLDQTI